VHKSYRRNNHQRKEYDVIQVNGQDGGGKDFDDQYIIGSTKKRIK
jgi:hypothetical protein